MFQIAVTGKPNVGKSSFFNSATSSTVETGNYPFTTIDANKSITNVVKTCPCVELDIICNPKNSECIDGKRYVYVELIDVAGLVPGAHEGKGLGNKFLDDLRQAKVFIHVVDASGSTDEEGRAIEPGTHDPLEDIEFLEYEIEMWMYGILSKNWNKLIRKTEAEKLDIAKIIYEQMSGTGINLEDVIEAKKGLNPDYQKWEKEDLTELIINLRRIAKPILIVTNKSDIPSSEENIKRIKKKYPDVIPTSADSEIALRNAAKAGFIKYKSGDSDFEIIDEGKLNKNQLNGLKHIKKNVLDKYGNTGVQKALNSAIFEILNMIVVYPVENGNKFTDNNGNFLPDSILIKIGSSPRDLAYLVHTDIGDKFLHAVNARKNIRVANDYKLCDGDIISIITS